MVKTSYQDIEKKTTMINLINSLKFPNLDIMNRIGQTGYIDFIKPNELVSNTDVMSGIDIYSRKFFVIKASFVFANINKQNFDTFSIFFQRYNDNEQLWHFCGHYGKYLMNTEGGTSIKQFELVYNLLKDNIVYLNKDMCDITRLNFSNRMDLEDLDNESTYPIYIKLSNYHI